MIGHSPHRRLPPRIATPEFWPATFDRFDEILSSAAHCQVEHIGASAGGRAIHGVVYRGRTDAPTVGLVGGVHGHEPQGPATCFNVISVLGYGRDLKGTAWPAIVDELNFVLVPVLNPDARARMPNSFVGLARQDVVHYGQGLTVEGEPNEAPDRDCDPARMMILGGRYNDAGQHIVLDSDPENLRTPEIRAAMDFLADHRPDVVLELHAHVDKPMLLQPTGLVPEDAQDRQRELCAAVLAKASAEQMDFNPEVREVTDFSISLYHHFAGAVPLALESPQGVLDSEAPWSHEQILDAGMFVVSCLCEGLMA